MIHLSAPPESFASMESMNMDENVSVKREPIVYHRHEVIAQYSAHFADEEGESMLIGWGSTKGMAFDDLHRQTTNRIAARKSGWTP